MLKQIKLISGISLLLLSACVSIPSSDGGDRAVAPVKLTQTSQGVQITTDDSVLFEVGSAIVSEKGYFFVDKVAEMLQSKTRANIIIEGHTDNTGNAQANITLSEKRSSNVREALISRKVQASRITSRGYGQSKPIAENTTIEGRQMNRRSEIIVVGETVEKVGGKDFLNTLTNALTNFIKNSGTVLEKVAGEIDSVAAKLTRTLGGGNGETTSQPASKVK